LSPAVRVTVTVTVPPAATLIGALTQAPCEKSVLMFALRAPEPSSTVTVSRRPAGVLPGCGPQNTPPDFTAKNAMLTQIMRHSYHR
jgi:hypothetical protein